ncbi:DNA-binding helix-turn-helix protein [Aeromicrobium marinum DSM 15272]|uniref:DNA-binding helix-turn-helix protein n=2 Tax=Aeromicrobium marinum TaxID=219314 RepID=E2S852_9ACTN|nr:DNA-binding helix-turn-helix protein [Aeromicrobium marinum DSM 15272]
MDYSRRTTEEWEAGVGAQFRALRLEQDLDQATVADRASVSLSALKALESGRGSSLRTVVRVARALGRVEWLESVHEVPEVSPLAIARATEGVRRPRRASPRRIREA